MHIDHDAFQAGLLISGVLELLWGVAALYTVHLIRQLDRRQAVRYELIQASAYSNGMAPEQWVSQVDPPTIPPQGPCCPHCERAYNPADYNPNAEHIYCEACKSEIPRDSKSDPVEPG